MPRCLIVSFLLLGAVTCLCAPVSAQNASLDFRRLTVDDGLLQNTVFALHQDVQGFIWIGTPEGLNRYDGYEFRTFRHDPSDSLSLPPHTVRDIADFPEWPGILWLGTDDGLVAYDRPRQRVRSHYRYLGTPRSRHVNVLHRGSDGSILVGTAETLVAFDPRSETFVAYEHDETPGLNVINLLADGSGSTWVATERGLFLADPLSRRLKRPQAVPPGLREAAVTSIQALADGSVWFENDRSQLFRYDPAAHSFQRVTVSFRRTPSPGAGREHMLWLGIRRQGVAMFDPETGVAYRVSEEDSPPNADVPVLLRRLLRDRSGLLWFGTDGGGVYVLDPRPPKIEHFAAARFSGGRGFVKSIEEDSEGRIWVATVGSGVHRYDPSTGAWVDYRPRRGYRGIRSDRVYALRALGDGRMLAGHDVGIDLFDVEGDRFTPLFSFPNSSSSDHVTFIHQDRSGRVWTGSRSGLFVAHGDTLAFHRFPLIDPHGAERFHILSMLEDRRGRLWFGTREGLAMREKPHAPLKWFSGSPHEPGSLSHNSVTVIHEDGGGELWIGTFNGLNRFAEEQQAFERYSERDGLPNAFIYGILEDDGGRLWVSTNRGISRFDRRQNDAARFRNFGIRDGLQSNEFNSGAYLRTQSGVMYFGGVNGLNRFHPLEILDSPIPAPVVLTDIRIFDVPVSMDLDAPFLQSISLRPSESVFSLRFAALEFTDPSRNCFAYKLDGIDQDWVITTQHREARYTNLPPGTYTFRVRAANNDGVWSTDGLQLLIVVHPPFWRTTWFLVLSTILLLASAGGTIRYAATRKLRRRLAHLERQTELARERARISRDVHDEVGASLTQIALLSELALKESQRVSANGNTTRHIDRVAGIARDVSQKLDEIVWAMNPRNDSLEKLFEYLASFAQELFAGTDIHLRLEYPDTWPEDSLNGEARHHTFLIMKEALTNAVKYARPSEILMRVESGAESVRICIEDDGRGFAVEASERRGNGILNIKERAERIGARLTISTECGGGCRICLEVPLEHAVNHPKW